MKLLHPYQLGKLILFALFLLFSHSLIAQQDSLRLKHMKDSLLHEVTLVEGRAKLERYQDVMAFLYVNESNLPSTVDYFLMAQKEADKQGDIDMGGTIRRNLIILFDTNRNYKDIIKYEQDVLSFLFENEMWEYYYDVCEKQITARYFSGQEEEAFELATTKYEQAKEWQHEHGTLVLLRTMGNIYTNSGRQKEAEECFRDGLEIEKKKDKITKNRLSFYFNLSNILLVKNRLDEAEPLVDEWEKDLRQFVNEEQDVAIHSFVNNLYRTRLSLYLQKKDYDKAWEYCDLVDELNPNAEYIIVSNSSNRCLILMGKKQYKEAYKWAEKQYEAAVEFGSSHNTNVALRHKAILQAYLGLSEEAENTINELVLRLEKERDEQRYAQLDDLRATYELDKATYEIEKLAAEKAILRQRWIIAFVACTLALVALMIFIIYSRRLAQKNRRLYEQVQELNNKEKAVERCLLSHPEEALSKEILLYRKLNTAMRLEKYFTDPDLSRKKLADEMGTNEMYLAEAIKAGSGETYSGYLSNLRLQYALELLDTNSEITLDAIAIDSGHGSYSQFFRSFSKKYGINPSEYRKLAKKQ
ncbi:helix-turn-helix domain-containing protein [Bacteroidales bacterium OttesenSCG-928-J19]|nr:helix-turn-helix domain-containing protein [Bacteroidales bacterium OttesenSCG-928-J19]